MTGPAHGRLRQQVDTLRREFLQEGELPFAGVLSSGCLAESLAEVQRPWKDRIFTPLVTLWVFLGQVLNADQSCRAAVARLIAHRAAEGLPPCSSDTGGYCQARARLPERFFAAVEGIHVHAFLADGQAEPTIDDTFREVTIDGVRLDPVMLRVLMAQNVMPSL